MMRPFILGFTGWMDKKFLDHHTKQNGKSTLKTLTAILRHFNLRASPWPSPHAFEAAGVDSRD